MHIFGEDVNVVKKFLVYAVVAAAGRCRIHRIELVEAVHFDILEAHTAILIDFYKFFVKAKR
jgi:hypothetical protein